MSEFLTTPEINEAWDRIARTSDGQIIYRHLQKLVMEISTDDGALQRCEGARSLAHNLMRLMANGIIDSDRYAIAFPVAKPVAVTGARGASRRVTADTFVPGYSDFGPTGSSGNSGTGTNGTGSGAG
jgi:hypothetical protein